MILKEHDVKPSYSRLFEPSSLGKVAIKNRIAMAPMAYWFKLKNQIFWIFMGY
jgi:hypothetical protein